MPEVVPMWVLGKHLTAITVQPCSRAADGTLTVLTAGSGGDSGMVYPTSMKGYIDYVRLSTDPMHDMIQAVDRSVAHYEITLEDYMVTLGEILHQKITGGWRPLLPTINGLYDHMKVVFTRGGQSYTFFGKRGSFNDGVQAYGKNTCELTLKSIDVGANLPLSGTM